MISVSYKYIYLRSVDIKKESEEGRKERKRYLVKQVEYVGGILGEK
jgi:hypothetical protein